LGQFWRTRSNGGDDGRENPHFCLELVLAWELSRVSLVHNAALPQVLVINHSNGHHEIPAAYPVVVLKPDDAVLVLVLVLSILLSSAPSDGL
jgi:hypothetical protein